MSNQPDTYLPSRRTLISALLALAATAGLVHYEDILLRLPAALHDDIRYIRILGASGSTPAPKPQAPAPRPAPAVLQPKAVAAKLQVNKTVEHAPATAPANEAKPTTPPALQESHTRADSGPGPDLNLEQPPLPVAPQPLVPIAAMPAPAPVGPADHSIQVQNMPAVAQALDQMDQHLVGGVGLVVTALVNSDGHVLQVVREQSGGDDVQDAAIMETLKQKVVKMSPPVPPGQQRWGEFRFDYAHATVSPSSAKPTSSIVP